MLGDNNKEKLEKQHLSEYDGGCCGQSALLPHSPGAPARDRAPDTAESAVQFAANCNAGLEASLHSAAVAAGLRDCVQ